MITEESKLFERGETIVSEKVMTPEVRVLFLVAIDLIGLSFL